MRALYIERGANDVVVGLVTLNKKWGGQGVVEGGRKGLVPFER